MKSKRRRKLFAGLLCFVLMISTVAGSLTNVSIAEAIVIPENTYLVNYDWGSEVSGDVICQSSQVVSGSALITVYTPVTKPDTESVTADSEYTVAATSTGDIYACILSGGVYTPVKAFTGWTYSGIYYINGESFVMPAANVTFTGSWVDFGKYRIMYDLNEEGTLEEKSLMVPDKDASNLFIYVDKDGIYEEGDAFWNHFYGTSYVSGKYIELPSFIIASVAGKFLGWVPTYLGNVIVFTATWEPYVTYYVKTESVIPPEFSKYYPINYTYGVRGSLKIYDKKYDNVPGCTGQEIETDWVVSPIPGANIEAVGTVRTTGFKLKTTDIRYSEDSQYLILAKNETINWYVVKWDWDGWHVDGVVAAMQAYTVNHYYEGSSTPFQTDTYYIPVSQTSVTAYALTGDSRVVGYTPDYASQTTAVAAEGDTVIDFYYDQQMTEYTVNHYYVGNSTPFRTFTYSAPVTQESVTAGALSVTGYTADAQEKSAALNDDGTTVINFWYSPILTPTATPVPTATPTPTATSTPEPSASPEPTATPEPTIIIEEPTPPANPVTPVPSTPTPTPSLIDIVEPTSPPAGGVDVLPQTGTTNNTIFYIAGIAVVAIGTVMVVRSRKKKKEDM